MFHRRQLQNVTNETMLMREYLTNVKSLYDQLAAGGHTVSNTEKFLFILSRLNDECVKELSP